MSKIERAKLGNLISAIGMAIACLATWINLGPDKFFYILGAILLGGAIGFIASVNVAMTSMPQMVALFNGFGGLASFLVGFEEFCINKAEYYTGTGLSTSKMVVALATIMAILIGGITFSGSLVAYLKLNGCLKHISGFFRRGLTVFFTLLTALSFVLFFLGSPKGSVFCFTVIAIVSPILGVFYVIKIGGGDMPVVIALLNSFSGLAASAAGFVIANSALVVAGCLVGASGLILTIVMCKAMNRSLKNVLFSGFGTQAVKPLKDGQREQVVELREITPEDAYFVLEGAQNVLIVPGYGMAVSQAQHAVRELSDLMKANGASIHYAIHPVAGRMPGHMNVLLAEANVPYEELIEIEDANREMFQVDVALVIGANDVVNPAAVEDANSPIYGMPTIEVSRAKNVFILKRGSGTGFSGLENTLFSKPNSAMIYGDAKGTLTAISSHFK